MLFVRRRIRTRPTLAALLLAATLLLRMLVPAGFMPGVAGGQFTIELCPGVVGPANGMAMSAMGHHADHRPGNAPHHDKAASPCAFAALAAPSLAGADPIQLVLALAFGVAAGLAMLAAPPVRHHGRLRPPLRGPPTTA